MDRSTQPYSSLCGRNWEPRLCERLAAVWRGILVVSALAAVCLASAYSASAATLVTGFDEEQIGSSWNEAAGIKFGPNGRMFVWERGGRVYSVDNDVPSSSPIVNISDEVAAYADHGMVGFALHPNWYTNGHIYLSYVVDRHHLLECNEPASGVGLPECSGNYNPNANQYSAATTGRVTRYTLIKPPGDTDFRDATTVDYNSRKVLFGVTGGDGCPILHNSHGIGEILFGTDGSLIIACGDGATANVLDNGSVGGTYWPDAINEGIIRVEENIGAFRAQMLESHSGKFLRIDAETGDGLPSNPFFEIANPRSSRSRTWALGIRNGFRITLRPGTGSHSITDGDPGALYFGDVGWNDFEEFDIVDGAGQNFGWPIYEGMSQFGNGYPTTITGNPFAPNPLFGSPGCDTSSDEFLSFQSLLIPATLDPSPVWQNPCDSGTPIPPTVDRHTHKMPTMTWNHDSGLAPRWSSYNGNTGVYQDIGTADPGGDTVGGPFFLGNASVGGVWYTGDLYPAEYKDTYFHADFGQGWIRNFKIDSNDQFVHTPAVAVTDFLTGAAAVVDLAVNPADEKLYYVDWASNVYRINYIGDGNFPPDALASSDKTYGPSPLTVQFSSAGSSDPEQGPLSFFWDFGDGDTSTEPNPSHIFDPTGSITGPMSYSVTLTVTDDQSETDQVGLSVSINNTPPSVMITNPVNLDEYPMTGDTQYDLTANISDSEHNAGQLACRWEVFLHHNTHFHNEPPDLNCTTTAVITPIGCTGESYFYRIRLTVTDTDGLAGSDEVSLFPDCAGSNAPPVAMNDSSIAFSGDSTVIDLVGNDSDDVSLNLATVNIVTPPSFGTISFVDTITGDVTYAHNGTASTTDGFSYTIADNEGLSSNIANVSLIIVPGNDNQAPSVPADLQARVTGTSTVKVTWDTSIDVGGAGVNGYRVLRDGAEVGFTQSTWLFDSNLPLGTTYSYTVTAVDHLDNESAQTPPAVITTANVDGIELRINAGRNDDYTDTLGNVWQFDQAYNTGITSLTQQSILFTNDDLLYQSERYDPQAAPDLTYSIPLANGVYVVNLHFADITLFTADIGDRLFDVSIEGSLVLDDYDVFAETGSYAAIFESFTVPVTDGVLDIVFSHNAQSPIISALEIIEYGEPDPTITILSPTNGATLNGPDITLDYALAGEVAAYDHAHFSVDGGPAIEDAALTGSILLSSLSNGSRTVTAQLVDAAHQPLPNPEAVDSVTFTVIPPDTQAPPVPGGLVAEAIGPDRVQLNFDDVTDTGGSGLAGYNIYRDGTLVGTETSSGFAETGLTPETIYAYAVSAFDGAGNESAQSAVLNVTTTAAAVWSGTDIGAVQAAGSFLDGPVVTVSGSGSDIWALTDEFFFVYQSLAGDGEISALVSSQTDTHPFAKAGVMIRESLAPDSPHASTFLTPQNGTLFLRRITAGNLSSEIQTAGAAAPYWLRIVREGDLFSSFRSPDGQTWEALGSVTVSMPANVLIGLAVSSVNDGVISTATFEAISFGGPADTEAPSSPASLTGNATGQTSVSLTWSASSDTGGSGLAGYRVYRDGVLTGQTTNPTFEDTGLAADTTYAYGVSAYDNAGNESPQTAPIGVTTDPQVPQINITSPLSGTSVNGPDVTVEYVTLGAPGNFNHIHFSVDGGVTTSDTALSGSFTLIGVAEGARTITAELVTEGHQTLTNPEATDSIAITVLPPDTQAPPVPAGLTATALGPDRIQLDFDDVVDNGGSGLAGYNVYRDGTLIGSNSQSTFVDTGLAAETSYDYTVSAFDNAGNESAQSAVIAGSTSSSVVWTGMDVGAVQATGSFVDGGVVTVSGSGRDIWYSNDEFYFVYVPFAGDGEVSALVSSQTDTHPFAKAGVMIRESILPDSAHVSTFLTPQSGSLFLRRVTNGGTSSETQTVGVVAPYWLKIVREGDLFTGYQSPDGQAWTMLDSVTVSMPTSILIGLAVSSVNDGVLSTATFENISFGTAADTQAPAVPDNVLANATGTTTASVTWDASVDTGGSGLAGYRVYRDGALVAVITGLSFDDTGLDPDTSYDYTVSAYDGAGNESAQSIAANIATDAMPDSDSDGVPDVVDNCTDRQNILQVDADADNYGNMCDADFNNDNIVNAVDLGIMKAAFFTVDPIVDLNSDGTVNVLDLGLLKQLFFQPPGPSGLVE